MSDVLITQTQKRKKVHIVWPDGQFTVKDIMKSIPEGQKNIKRYGPITYKFRPPRWNPYLP